MRGRSETPDFQWTEERVNLLKERYLQDGPVKLAKLFGTTRMAVTCKARRLGLGLTRATPRKPLIWKDEMIAAMKERYVTEGAHGFAKEYGVPVGTIYRQAAKMGLSTIAGREAWSRRKAETNVSCDTHYFDQWSPNMAYIFGFLMGDGSITKRLCDAVVGIALKDRSVIDFIRKELKSTRPIYYAQRNRGKDGVKRVEACYLYLSSTILVRKLMELGMKPGKTYTDEPFPYVPVDMLPHFIRGFFDADGSAYVRSSDGLCGVNFVGSWKFITGLRDALFIHSNMKPNAVGKEQKKTLVGRVIWRGEKNIRAFFNYIYPSGHGFCLQRKKTILENWLSNLVDSDTSSTVKS